MTDRELDILKKLVNNKAQKGEEYDRQSTEN